MPDLPLWLWMITFATGLVASVVTTITGIGEGMMIYGILSFFFGLKLIIPCVAVAQLVTASLRFWLFRGAIHWRLASYFFLGVLPGIYGGTLLFHWVSERALRRVLGVFLLGFVGYEVCQRKAIRVAPRVGLLPLGGCCAGLLSGSIGVAGPLLVLVFLRYGLLREELVAMTTLYFLLGSAQRTLLYWHQGRLPEEQWGLAVALGLAMLGGVYLGRLVLPHVSRPLFLKLVLGMLALFGIHFVSF
jgi:uncharacterized membrane protein YfcA